jgi:hypothetical protein
MCLLCNDEAAYLAYMNYLDAAEARGEEPDFDKAVDAAAAALKAADGNAALKTKVKSKPDYMSAFICDPVDQ